LLKISSKDLPSPILFRVASCSVLSSARAVEVFCAASYMVRQSSAVASSLSMERFCSSQSMSHESTPYFMRRPSFVAPNMYGLYVSAFEGSRAASLCGSGLYDTPRPIPICMRSVM